MEDDGQPGKPMPTIMGETPRTKRTLSTAPAAARAAHDAKSSPARLPRRRGPRQRAGTPPMPRPGRGI